MAPPDAWPTVPVFFKPHRPVAKKHRTWVGAWRIPLPRLRGNPREPTPPGPTRQHDDAAP